MSQSFNSDNKEDERHVVHNPYDSLFKAFMSNIAVAKDFFALQLPADIFQRINTDKLFLCPQSFIDNHLKHKHVDVLYRTEFDHREGYIYILTEQQTQSDPKMSFRIMQYVMRIIEHHQKQFKTHQYPLVYPLIYYVGKRPYTCSTDFYDGFGQHKSLAKELLTNPFPVAQITGVDEQKLQEHPLAGALAKIYQLAYARDVMVDLLKLESFFRYMDSQGHADLLISVVQFLLNNLGKGDAEKIITIVSHMVSKEAGGNMLTLADKMKQKAMNQGLVQGIQIVAKKLLAEGMSETWVIKVTGLSSDEINHLKKDLCETQH
ncbi:MAG TPA: Rpn family recombination-promoting nuclease/putative transposase [Gammaproteobacteria bacterium]|nr:Rpn family recombination-promoting nuclease/putative transposase [Gammaproteobacteria bacterium]